MITSTEKCMQGALCPDHLRSRIGDRLGAALVHQAAVRGRLGPAIGALEAARLDQVWDWITQAGKAAAELSAALADAQRQVGELSALEFDLRFAAENPSRGGP